MTIRIKDMYARVDDSGEDDNGFRYQPATASEIDAAAGVTELRLRLEQYQTLIDTQQGVIIEQRLEITGLKAYIAETEERGRQAIAQAKEQG